MAALNVDQFALVRRWIGDEPDDAGVQGIYDRTGTLQTTAREILETRRANLIKDPASFTVPGVYSQSTVANLKAIADLISDLANVNLDDPDAVLGTDVRDQMRVVHATPRQRR